DLHGPVAAFTSAAAALQTLLAEVRVTLGAVVSSSIKGPTGNPFFDAGGWGGGCGTGGGCGCKKTG
ncbi:YlbF family regulator, partial [Bacillus thuringiensis]|nr:YlbF family regulator [Bacillus thuringiensis]